MTPSIATSPVFALIRLLSGLAEMAAGLAVSVGWGVLLSFVATVCLVTAFRIRLQSTRLWVGARFARAADLRHFLTDPAPGLSPAPLGGPPEVSPAWFPLGYFGRRRPLARLREEDLSRHVLVTGLTGAHKTTAITFPVLLEAARAGVSAVALDLKYGEADSLVLAAPEWGLCGRDVLVYAPLDPLSLRWNPLAGCRTMGGAQRLAAMLFDDDDAGPPDLMYWMGAERQLCAVLCFAVATDGAPPTLERVRRLCEAGPVAVHSYVQGHPAAHDFEARLGSYRAMLPKDEAGILQGVASRLEAWGDEGVCRATGIGPAEDMIDLDRLRREPILLIVGIPQPALARLRWLCHLFLRDLASRLLRPRLSGENVRVIQVIEELPSWGRLPGFADHLATFRSRRVSVLATIQSEAQGEYVYGRDGWAAIAANLGTKIYFPWLADSDAERLSRAIGTTSIEEISHSRGWGAGGRRVSEHRRSIQMPLRRPEELQGIDAAEDEILVRCPRVPPARLWCPPFYSRSEYHGRIPDIPPSTAALVVCHHLRYHAVEDAASQEPVAQPGLRIVPSALTWAPEYLPPASGTGQGLNDPSAASGCNRDAEASLEDLTALSQFAERLLTSPVDSIRPHIRPILRSGRLVEVRADPRIALSLLNPLGNAHSLLRRWAELRWVRQVRPVLVLERHALDALDPAMKARFATLAPRSASGAGRGG